MIDTSKFTPFAKKSIYEMALIMLTEGVDLEKHPVRTIMWQKEDSGLCELIRISCFEKGYVDEFISSDELEEVFTEFFSFKPSLPETASWSVYKGKFPTSLFWWPVYDRDVRKKVLEKCIEMCT